MKSRIVIGFFAQLPVWPRLGTNETVYPDRTVRGELLPGTGQNDGGENVVNLVIADPGAIDDGHTYPPHHINMSFNRAQLGTFIDSLVKFRDAWDKQNPTTTEGK